MIATSRPSLLRAFAHEVRALDVVGGGAVREIEAHDVDAGGEHPLQDVGVAGRGAERGDDLGVAWHGVPCRRTLMVDRACYGNSPSRRRAASLADLALRPTGRSVRAAPLDARDARRAASVDPQPAPRFQHRHRRQRLALEELEERAAAGRDVADAVGDAELVDGRDRVAAARDREGVRGRDRVGDRPRAVGERVELEHADRAVPHDGAGRRDRPLQRRRSTSGPMSRIRSSGSTFSMALSSGFGVGGELLRDDGVDGDRHLAGILVEDRLRLADELRLGQRLADVPAGGEDERVRDAAADDQRVDLRGERAQDGELGGDLRAGDDRDQRPARVRERARRARRARPPAAGPRTRWARTSRCRASSPPRDATCRTRR